MTDPQEIWAKHAVHDKSGEAARQAEAALQQLDPDAADYWQKRGNLVRQLMVTHRSAVYKSTAPAATEHLLAAIATITNCYPVSSQNEEALQRAQQWDGIYGVNQSAHLVCLRDFLHLLDTLSMVSEDAAVKDLRNNVLALLLRLSEERKSERFALIALIEEAPYERARVAYRELCATYGATTQLVEKDQVITVTTRFLARALKVKNAEDGLLALEQLFLVLVKDMKLAKRLALDLAKAVFPSLKERIINRAIAQIKNDQENRANLEAGIQSVLKLAFVGVGREQVVELRTDESKD